MSIHVRASQLPTLHYRSFVLSHRNSLIPCHRQHGNRIFPRIQAQLRLHRHNNQISNNNTRSGPWPIRQRHGRFAAYLQGHDRARPPGIYRHHGTTANRYANPFDPAAPNCQTWIAEFTYKLVAERLIDASVRSILQTTPRRI